MLHRVSDKLTHRINYSRTPIETNPVGKLNKCCNSFETNAVTVLSKNNLQLVPKDIGIGIVGDICIGTRGQGLLGMIICNNQSNHIHHHHQNYKIYLSSFRS